MQGDRLHQCALNAGVDLEAGRRRDRAVVGIQHGVDLGQGDALNRDRDLDEVAGLGLEVGQAVEAADFPGGGGVSQPQLLDGIGPAQIGEFALAFDVLADVDRASFAK